MNCKAKQNEAPSCGRPLALRVNLSITPQKTQPQERPFDFPESVFGLLYYTVAQTQPLAIPPKMRYYGAL